MNKHLKDEIILTCSFRNNKNCMLKNAKCNKCNEKETYKNIKLTGGKAI